MKSQFLQGGSKTSGTAFLQRFILHVSMQRKPVRTLCNKSDNAVKLVTMSANTICQQLVDDMQILRRPLGPMPMAMQS